MTEKEMAEFFVKYSKLVRNPESRAVAAAKVFKALSKDEKFKLHDLRVNEDDLPTDGKNKTVYVERFDEDPLIVPITAFYTRQGTWCDSPSGKVIDWANVIAWREIPGIEE